jgi:hypothetical protein
MTAATMITKLNVAETLEHATEALAAHRAWMKKRASLNSVSPAAAPLSEHTASLTVAPGTWALGSGKYSWFAIELA